MNNDVCVKTEMFFRKSLEEVQDILRKNGYVTEWELVTFYQQESQMYNLMKNKYAMIKKIGQNMKVDYFK